MHGLPKDLDTSIFLNRELEQVCFTANQLVLHFDKEISIIASGSFGCFSGSQDKKEVIHKAPVNSSDLMKLLGHRIAKVLAKKDGTLDLQFDNAQQLVFYDDPNYESYDIYIGKNRIIV